MSPTKTEEELMAEYANGSQEAFVELFQSYKGRIFSFLNRRVAGKSTALVDDLFQLTWLKVHQGRKSFDPSKKFSTWIFTIANNSMLDHFKRSSTKYEEFHNDPDESEASESPDANSEDLMIKGETTKVVEAALASLPQGMRDAVVLCELEGMASKEAALVLGKTDNAVRQNLFKGKKLLRTYFAGQKGVENND